MHITGIICEYNPLHLGHKHQLDTVRSAHPEGAVVCLMSGNFVQRGAPAVFDKTLRAKAAILSGADLVLELPVTAALCSAEGFASAGVQILSGFCDTLSFGAEDADADRLLKLAQALLQPEFPDALHLQLDAGLSFPAARQAALEAMGLDAAPLGMPNNILAAEYCKAILQLGVKLQPAVILRQGSYHDSTPDPQNPSATALRQLLSNRESIAPYVPQAAANCYQSASIHTVENGERAILGRLRCMTDEEFAALPHGSEGLWRKLMHAARTEATLEGIISATKSKRYTRTRIDRMVLCAFLGITDTMLCTPAPYVRVLALNDIGRQILKQARKSGSFPNLGEKLDDPYQLLEDRCSALYGLFADTCEPPDAGQAQRIYYHDRHAGDACPY